MAALICYTLVALLVTLAYQVNKFQVDLALHYKLCYVKHKLQEKPMLCMDKANSIHSIIARIKRKVGDFAHSKKQ